MGFRMSACTRARRPGAIVAMMTRTELARVMVCLTAVCILHSLISALPLAPTVTTRLTLTGIHSKRPEPTLSPIVRIPE